MKSCFIGNNDKAILNGALYTLYIILCACRDTRAWLGWSKKYYRFSEILYIPHMLYSRRGSSHLRYSFETPTFYQNYLAMRNTAGVTSSKPIAVWSQSMSCVGAVNPLVAFYDIHGWKGERERCYSFILSGIPHETILEELLYENNKV
jgi:hypothetical protein